MDFIKSLRTRCKRRRRVKTPTVIQMDAMACGAAAVGIVLGYYGRHVPLEELRRACGVSRDGSKASNMLKAARQYGLIAQGYSIETEALKDLCCPYIVFWNFNHFVVVEGFRKGRVYLNDPATGPRTVSLDEFDRAFTGIVLMMEPGVDFEPGAWQLGTLHGLRTRLRGAGRSMTYCLGAGFFLVLPGLAIPVLTQVFVDHLLIAGMHDWLGPLLLGMLMTAIFKGVVQHLQLQALRRLKLRFAAVMSSRFLWHLLHLPLNYYTQRYAGEISQRLSLNEKLAQVLAGQLATTVIDVSMMCLYAAIMLQYDVTLTMIGLGCAVINMIALRWLARSRTDANMRLLQEMGKVGGVTIAGLQQIDTLKAAALESDFFARWAGLYANATNTKQALEVSNQLLGLLPTLLVTLTSAAVLVFGGLRVMDGHLSIGMLVAFQSLMQSFLAPITSLVNFGGTLQELQGDLRRLDDVLSHPTLPGPPAETTQKPITPETFRLQGHVEVRRLTFGHSPVSPPLLDDVSLSLTPGKQVAIVGASGSGKSTLAKLVCGLYEPWRGDISFDGQPRSQIPRAILTHSVAMVDQDMAFFAATVRENLTLWDTTIPDSQLIRACKDAAVHDVITALPGGYDGMLLEGAANLSGGERQRLELARALVCNPAVLVLDEATSALDAETEGHIVEHLRRRGCACLIVAHRLSTIRDCDEIIVLDQGKVVERGVHAILWRSNGVYRRLLTCEDGAIEAAPIGRRVSA